MKKLISLTFDDANLVQYTKFFSILEKYGLKGTFYVVTSQIDMPGKLTGRQLSILYNHKHEIGSHTHTHPHLTKLPDKFVDFELRKSKEVLRKFKPETFAYPAGDCNPRVKNIAKKYYIAARGYHDLSEPGANPNYGVEKELYELKIMHPAEFLKMRKMIGRWIIIVIHGSNTTPKLSFFSWFIKNKLPLVIKSKTITTSGVSGFLKNLATKQIKEDVDFEALCKTILKKNMKVVTVADGVREIYRRAR
jgi:peptidoglycan/xylan/chitin deacetylase (PgdA/CDA1 family)